MKVEVAELVADEDAIAFAYTFTGTQNGPLMAIPATGKKVKIRGMQISKFRDGKDGGTLGQLGSARHVPADRCNRHSPTLKSHRGSGYRHSPADHNHPAAAA